MTSLFKIFSHYYQSDANEQSSSQTVNIDNWSVSGDFDPYAEGTRSKYAVRCPEDCEYPFLIKGHRYLYKKTFDRKGKDGNPPTIFYEQFWIEIIAYKLGRFLGIEVPPTFLACRTLRDGTKEYACLIEWFHGYPNSPSPNVSKGGDFMTALINDYDRNKGTQHNAQTICQLFESIEVEDWIEQWAKIIFLDTLIGNTDRHQENWEVISHFGRTGILRQNLSPAFDNGTAMGYEIFPRKMPSIKNDPSNYISKGYHHMKWLESDSEQIAHFELILRFTEKYPQAKIIMREIISRDISSVCKYILDLSLISLENAQYQLTLQRAELIVSLLEARYKKIKEILES